MTTIAAMSNKPNTTVERGAKDRWVRFLANPLKGGGFRSTALAWRRTLGIADPIANDWMGLGECPIGKPVGAILLICSPLLIIAVGRRINLYETLNL